MTIRFSAVAVAVAAVFPAMSAIAAAEKAGEAVIVSATRIDLPDVDATYASEVHSRKDIERSGASTLVDYLAQQTSLQILPSYGNRFVPRINMRGYGAGDGYQNVVVSVDGRRLNNIDMVPQLLGAIPLVDIDRIEIAKGSGSVVYGDGATAGTIQIYTRPREGASIEAYAGNFGAIGTVLNAGLVRDLFSLSATFDHSRNDGFSDRDPSGHRDESSADNWRVGLAVKPAVGLKLDFDVGGSRIDTRYPGALTLAQFRRDPAQNNGANYTHQKFESDYWVLGGAYDLTPNWRVTAQRSFEDKLSKFVNSSFKADYQYIDDEFAIQYLGESLLATAGFQAFDGVRESTYSFSALNNTTTKRNEAIFIQGQYELGRFSLSAGARGERIEYKYKSISGARLDDDERLASWDIGANYRVDNAFSLFANYNRAFQAPDIDRFFNFGGSFNGFISPADVRTLTVGVNHVTAENRLKVSAFRANLKDEIYYFDSGSYLTSFNTNIDRSYKYGLEVQDAWHVTQALTATLNYTWTRAVIEREDQGGGAFDGKQLPGVPRHGVVAGLNVRVGQSGSFSLSHAWRSKAYSATDFDNNNAQKQREYQSTDLAYRHRLRNVELYAAVANIFSRENGVWVDDNQIYPVNFERTWKLGAKLSF